VVLIDRHQRYEPTMGVGQRHRDVTCVEVEYRRGLDPLVGLGLPSYSLSSAMVLTAISDRSAVFAGVRCRTDSLTGKDFRTLVYGSGRGAGNLQAGAPHCGHRMG
jgi:hypothetical protein